MAIYKGNTKLDANGLQVSSVPTGSIMQYDGNTIPAGYEEVNGFDNYSTTEQRIGTWIDGKPLYRIVKQITTRTISTDNQGANESIDLTALNIEYLLLEHATLKDIPNNSLYPLPVFRGQTLGVRLVFTPTTAYIWNYSTLYNNCVCTFSILYTKTTDSAS